MKNKNSKKIVKYIINRIIVLVLTVFIVLVVSTFIGNTVGITNTTWIYSSSMQTLAALIALLPISYAYYLSNLENEIYEQYDSYVIEKLKSDVYIEMIAVIIFCLFVIAFNLLSFFFKVNETYALFIAFITLDAIGFIAFYIFRLFNPNKVKEVLKEFDVKSTLSSNVEITLDQYITDYLSLEKLVKDYISNTTNNEIINDYPLYDIIDNLSKDYLEIESRYDDFKEIIFHRNNLIHNYTDASVDYGKYLKIIDLKTIFSKLNISFIKNNIFANVASVNALTEKALKEFLIENKENLGNIDIRDEVSSLLHSYFISDLYNTISLSESEEVDFEIVQNNFSKKKIVGIDIKTIPSKNINSLIEPFFKRMKNRFLYVMIINYEIKNKSFTIYYKTKDNLLKQINIR